MKNAEEERYVFYRLAQCDIREALGSLSAWSAEYSAFVQYSLLQRAVMAYVRPFKPCNTIYQHFQAKGDLQKRIALRESVVPEDALELHKMLVRYRDQAYAHKDLAHMNPRLSYWKGDVWEYPLIVSPTDKLPLHLRIDQMALLFSAVEGLLGGQIAEIEAILQAANED